MYPEARFQLDRDPKGNYIKSDSEKLFVITPEESRIDDTIDVDVKSVIADTPELEKQQLLELNNLLVPLFSGDPALNKKPAMMLLKKYDQDPADWLPESWLVETPAVPVNPMAPGVEPAPADGRSREAEKIIPGSRLKRAAQTVVGKIGRLFTKINPKTK